MNKRTLEQILESTQIQLKKSMPYSSCAEELYPLVVVQNDGYNEAKALSHIVQELESDTAWNLPPTCWSISAPLSTTSQGHFRSCSTHLLHQYGMKFTNYNSFFGFACTFDDHFSYYCKGFLVFSRVAMLRYFCRKVRRTIQMRKSWAW